MHPYKRTVAALIVAGALLSQTPAITHAEDEISDHFEMQCSMSRSVDGEDWSSGDCAAIEERLEQDMEGLQTVIDSLALPVRPAPVVVPVPVLAQPRSESGPGFGLSMDAITTFIQKLLAGVPLF